MAGSNFRELSKGFNAKTRKALKVWVRRLLRWAVISSVMAIVLLIGSVVSLRWINPITSSVMMQHHIDAIIQDQAKPIWQWADWAAVSPYVPLAIMAAEDQRFPEHYGIDFTELKARSQPIERKAAEAQVP